MKPVRTPTPRERTRPIRTANPQMQDLTNSQLTFEDSDSDIQQVYPPLSPRPPISQHRAPIQRTAPFSINGQEQQQIYNNQRLLPDEDVHGLDNQRSSQSHQHRHIKSDNALQDLPLNQRRSPRHQPSASGQQTASADSSLTSRHSGAPTRREEVGNTNSHRCINDPSPPRRNPPPNLNNNRRRSPNSSPNNKKLPKKLSLPHQRSPSCTKSLHLRASRPNPAGAPHLVKLRTQALQGV